MTLREFRWLIRYATPKGEMPTATAKGWLTPEQLAVYESKPFVALRNLKKRNPSYWRRICIHQCWRLMFPGEPEK
jgi:hypothetical protein